jgi:GTP-binding protein
MPSTKLVRSPLPTIALVGRANVGKSTLWNKITGTPRALVSPTPHTTRDRNFGRGTWRGRAFELIDTGGLDVEDDEIGRGIWRQAERAIKESDLVIFMIDGKVGVLPEDRELAKIVRKAKTKAILAINKVDHPRDFATASEGGLKALGFGDGVAISGSTGKGVGDLLDAAYNALDEIDRPPLDEIALKETQDAEDAEASKEGGPLRLVIMGRPNVGKSSLVNSILGEERVIASPIAHTTREPQDTPFDYKGHPMMLVDTAGMRRRANVTRGLEEEGLDRNREALKEADVAFLVFDTTEDPKRQDRNLAGMMEGSDKGLVLVANKWDLIEDKKTGSTDAYERVIRQLFPFLDWAPMVFVSAKKNLRTTSLLDVALKVQEERNRTIDYNALNRFLKGLLKQKKPIASYGPKSPYIHDIAQVGTEPPKFLITIRGEKETIHPSWLKFAEKRLRDKFGFEGTPVVITATNVPISKSERERNVQGPGMEAVAGKIKEKWMTAKKKNVRWRP